jgi:lipid-A-disaccharide synthase
MNTGLAAGRLLKVFLIAGEESGDALGAGLMRALSEATEGRVSFSGVGGRRMEEHGMASLFPMEEIALHGITAVLARLPKLMQRIDETAAAVLTADPDVLIAIDCPAFSLRVAKRVRRRNPRIAVVDYVSPQVWAYWQFRARKMARFVDRVLAILPFEPAFHRQIGGPPCTYVGHPLITRLGDFRPAPGERLPLQAGRPPVLLVLPGSRRSEIGRLTAPFGETVRRVVDAVGPVDVLLPAVPRLIDEIRARIADWPVKPTIVEGEAEKLAAFRRAHAALAASGTVSLELALAGIATVVAYRTDPIVRPFKFMLRAKSIVLPNLILDELAVPEFIDGDGDPARLAASLTPLLRDGPERAAQLAAFDRLERLMDPDGPPPSVRAAEAVLETLKERQVPFLDARPRPGIQ